MHIECSNLIQVSPQTFTSIFLPLVVVNIEAEAVAVAVVVIVVLVVVLVAAVLIAIVVEVVSTPYPCQLLSTDHTSHAFLEVPT